MKCTWLAAAFTLAAIPALGQNIGAAQTSDQAFVDLAAQTDMTEAHLGQLAQDQAASQGVKDYAQSLVTDHTASYKQLGMIAAKANLNEPKGLNETQQSMIAPLAKLKGKAFDKKYLTAMVAGHETAIAAFNKEARDGQNPDLKNYAQQSIPTLEKHKAAAQALLKMPNSMSKGS